MLRYSAFDALQLVSPNDDYFHCENCNGELVAERDKIAAEEMGGGEDSSRKGRHEKLKDMLQKMEVSCHSCFTAFLQLLVVQQEIISFLLIIFFF